MKSYITAAIILVIIIVAGCNKIKHDDLYGDGILAGQLTYYNPYSGEYILKPAGKRTVHIAYSPSDTLNFIYNATTNDLGYFVFTNLDKDKRYDLFFSDTIGGVRYTAFLTRSPYIDTLRMVALPDTFLQNGLSLTIRGINNQPLQSVGATAYDNHDAYLSDSINNTTTGGVHAFTTGIYGTDIWFNAPPGTYYIIARKTAGALLLTGYSTATIGVRNITLVTLVLSSPQNTLNVHVTDIYNTPVNGVSVYLYTSKALWLSDTVTHSFFSYSATSNSTGVAIFSNLPPTNYFVSAYKKITDSVKLAGAETLVMPATGTKDTIIEVR